ncbi:hypothetical protein ACFSSC_07855 [Corynebacterium mendelii]|uniref:Uncharacterized protein n=1 Tax=Corynebacterium mendelii TaxID=2765362 RepID=A0A939IY48_9CORY|nr:hypothetical protein [Corynebacterium mendelii]MBN9644753.1 hypothetical protein [Corynebacterium mendelii]
MGKKKIAKARQKLAKGKVKKKCCRSKPRCITCPVVVKRLEKASAMDLPDKKFALVLDDARRK